jgi:CDP-diacylglycerol--glycerol-3-phosphate 3-phosphatidyltransferase
MTPRVDRATIWLIFSGVTAIICATTGLRSYVPTDRWIFAATAIGAWLYLVMTLRRLRRKHSSFDENIPAPIAAATWLTIARGFLIALVAGYAVGPVPSERALWVPGSLYALAAIADRGDGALARRRAQVTVLGAELDVATDAVGLFAAPLVGVLWGRLPPWYLALACAYPAFRLALRIRRAIGWPIFPSRLGPDPRARFFAGVQMTVVAAALFPVLPRAIAWGAATMAMLPTLALFAGEWRRATASAADGRARAERLDT